MIRQNEPKSEKQLYWAVEFDPPAVRLSSFILFYHELIFYHKEGITFKIRKTP